MTYRYKLINQEAGSQRYGNCEICKKPVDTVYSQTEEKEFERPDGSIGWTQGKCMFGHKECLLSIRK